MNEDDATELLPCPFCGGGASITEDNYKGMRNGVVFIVGCDNEECDLQFPGCDTRTLATKIWNRRAASVPRWTRVEDGLPNENDSFLVSCRRQGFRDWVREAFFRVDKGWFERDAQTPLGGIASGQDWVIAWMPLPQYTEEQDEQR